MIVKYSLRCALAVALVLLMTSAGAAQGAPGAPSGRDRARARAGAFDSPGSPSPARLLPRAARHEPERANTLVSGATCTGTTSPTPVRPTAALLLRRQGGRRRRRVSPPRRRRRHAACAHAARAPTPIVLENCFPGTTAWKTTGAAAASNGGIEGFATDTSVNAGGSVDLKVNTARPNVPYHVEIYRTGSYGGTQGRLVSTLVGLTASSSPPASTGTGNTGLLDCSNWARRGDDHDLAGLAVGRLPAAPRARRTTAPTTTSCWSCATTAATPRRPLRRPGLDLPGLQQLRRQVALRLELERRQHRRGHHARGQGLVRPALPAVRHAADATGTRASTSATSRWLERQGYDVSLHASVDLAARRRAHGRPATCSCSPLARRVLVERDAQRAHRRAQRRHVARVRSAPTRSTGRSATRSPFRPPTASGLSTRRPQSGRRGSESAIRPAPGAIRPGANQPENALLGPDVHRRQRPAYLPLGRHRTPRARTRSGATPRSRPCARPDRLARHHARRLGVERPRRQRPRAGRRADALRIAGQRQPVQDAARRTRPATATVEATSTRPPAARSCSTRHQQLGPRPRAQQHGDGRAQREIQQATANMLADMGVQPDDAVRHRRRPAGAPDGQRRTPAAGATGVADRHDRTATFDRALIRDGHDEQLHAAPGRRRARGRDRDLRRGQPAHRARPEPAAARRTPYTARVRARPRTRAGTPLAAERDLELHDRASAAAVVEHARRPPNATGVAARHRRQRDVRPRHGPRRRSPTRVHAHAGRGSARSPRRSATTPRPARPRLDAERGARSPATVHGAAHDRDQRRRRHGAGGGHDLDLHHAPTVHASRPRRRRRWRPASRRPPPCARRSPRRAIPRSLTGSTFTLDRPERRRRRDGHLRRRHAAARRCCRRLRWR